MDRDRNVASQAAPSYDSETSPESSMLGSVREPSALNQVRLPAKLSPQVPSAGPISCEPWPDWVPPDKRLSFSGVVPVGPMRRQTMPPEVGLKYEAA